jgi:transcriptional regulator of acetoin/glycerol metabolism
MLEPNDQANTLASLEQVTREHVMAVLQACGGSQTRAASVLEIDRKTVYRMLRKWGVLQPATR